MGYFEFDTACTAIDWNNYWIVIFAGIADTDGPAFTVRLTIRLIRRHTVVKLCVDFGTFNGRRESRTT